jgi:hypothetical protein
MQCIHIIRFHDEEQRMLGIRAVPPDQLDSLYRGVEQRIGTPFILGTSLWSVYLRDVE